MATNVAFTPACTVACSAALVAATSGVTVGGKAVTVGGGADCPLPLPPGTLTIGPMAVKVALTAVCTTSTWGVAVATTSGVGVKVGIVVAEVARASTVGSGVGDWRAIKREPAQKPPMATTKAAIIPKIVQRFVFTTDLRAERTEI